MREYPDSPQVGVCTVIIKDAEILLIRRGIAPSKGLWAMPGGSVKLGETLAEVAERETREETGITVKAQEIVANLDFIEKDDELILKAGGPFVLMSPYN